MTNSPRLGIGLMAENVLQKEVIFNEAVIQLDVVVGGTVNAITTSIPSSPADGDAYIVGSGASGPWTDRDDKIAFYYNGWHFISVPTKKKMYVNAASGFYTKQDHGWTADPAGTPTNLEDLANIAVGTPTEGQVLTYDGTAHTWKARNVAAKLKDLGDVALDATPAHGDYLVFDNADKKWHNVSAPAVPNHLTDLEDVDVGSLAHGRVAYWTEDNMLGFADPSSLIVLGDLGQIGNVVTSGAVVGDQLTWNGTVWGPSHRVTTFSFAGMIDGPGSMSGKAGQFLVINSTEDALTYMTLEDVIAYGAFTLSHLPDVDVTGLAAGSILKWNDSEGKWAAGAPPAGTLAGLTDVAVAEGDAIDGKYLKWDKAANKWVPGLPEGTTYHWEGEGVDEGTVRAINFTGAGVGVTNIDGTLTVTISGVSTLAALTDVDEGAGPTNGDLLQYETLSGKWKPKDINSVFGSVTGSAQPATYELGPFAPPTAGIFPTRIGYTGASATSVANRGFLVQPATSSGATQYLGMLHTLAANTVPWEVSCRVVPSAYADDGFFGGVMVRRSANGRMCAIGISDDSGNTNRVYMTYATSTGVETQVGLAKTDCHWVKLAWDGTNLKGYVSPDGLMWQLVGSIAGATALSGVPDQVGLYQRMGNTLVGGVGALWTYYDDPDYPAALRTRQGYVNVGLANLTDVDLTGLINGSVLTWDDTDHKWVVGTAGSGGGGASALADLTDVDESTAPTNGQALVYDSASGKWKPGTVASGGGGSGGGSVLRLTNSTDQIVSASTWTTLSWDQHSIDDASVYDSGNTSRAIVPAGVTRARVQAFLSWDPNNSNIRHHEIRKNAGGRESSGVAVTASVIMAGDQASTNMDSGWIEVTPGDYFEVFVYQNSGDTRSVDATDYPSFLQLEFAGSESGGGGASNLVDLGDVDIDLPIPSAVVAYDNAKSKWAQAYVPGVTFPGGYKYWRIGVQNPDDRFLTLAEVRLEAVAGAGVPTGSTVTSSAWTDGDLTSDIGALVGRTWQYLAFSWAVPQKITNARIWPGTNPGEAPKNFVVECSSNGTTWMNAATFGLPSGYTYGSGNYFDALVIAPVTLPTLVGQWGDYPVNYTGKGSKFLAVKTDESGIEFVDAPSGGGGGSWDSGGSAGAASVAVGAHRYWKIAGMIPHGNNDNVVALVELSLYNGATALTVAAAKGGAVYDTPYPISNLFDGDTSTLWATKNYFASYILFDLGSAKDVTKIKWTTRDSPYQGQAPMEFEWYYSDDGVNFTLVGNVDSASVMGSGWFTPPSPLTQYTIPVPTTRSVSVGVAAAAVGAHRYWKFANMLPFSYNADAVTLNELTPYDGSTALTVAAARCNYYYGGGSYGVSNLFDGNLDNFWVGIRGCDLTLDFGSPVSFNKVKFRTPTVSVQTPVAATFCYSDDGITFTEVAQMDFAVAYGLADNVVPAAEHDYTVNLPTTLRLPGGSTSVATMADVEAAGVNAPKHGQLLRYNATTSKWEPSKSRNLGSKPPSAAQLGTILNAGSTTSTWTDDYGDGEGSILKITTSGLSGAAAVRNAPVALDTNDFRCSVRARLLHTAANGLSGICAALDADNYIFWGLLSPWASNALPVFYIGGYAGGTHQDWQYGDLAHGDQEWFSMHFLGDGTVDFDMSLDGRNWVTYKNFNLTSKFGFVPTKYGVALQSTGAGTIGQFPFFFSDETGLTAPY